MAIPIAGTASADGIWAEHELTDAPITGVATNVQPSAYQLYRLDSFLLGFRLNAAPPEGTGSITLSLPMPDGSYRIFNIWQRPVLDPATQAAHPDILALAGVAADDPRVRIVLDYSPSGFNAMIDLTENKTWMVDQHPNGTDDYVIAYRSGDTPQASTCLCPDHIDEQVPPPPPSPTGAAPVPENCVGGQLRKMDLGIAVSENTTASLGGQAAALAHVNTLVNRLNLIYERDLAVRFVLVSGTTTIYDAGNPEPNAYPHEAVVGAGPGSADLVASDNNLDAALGATGYDVGFSLTLIDLGGGGGTSGSGLAARPALCTGSRGRNVSAYSNHTINDSYIDLMAHEVGHQFGAAHTTSGSAGNCAPGNGGFSTGSAVETGSGSTIMGYAGICGSDNLQNDGDLYFHGFSLQQMNNWIASQSCYEICPPDGNTIPTVTAADCVIPKETPFTLEATANDGDGDPLTYAWEQVDVSPISHPVTLPDDGAITLFRSYPPVTSPTRDFPSLAGVLSGVLPLGEKYPLGARTMNFMVTVRDGVNGACSHQVEVQVTDDGPITFIQPSVGQLLQCTQTVTWDVAGTAALAGAGNVNILLSTDGGLTFPTTLAANVPNNGSQTVTLPNLSTTTARIRIEPVGGCWWVVSDEFSIEPCPSGKLFATGNNTIDDTCGFGNSNENGVIDPGESGFLVDIELSATTAPVNSISGTLSATTPGVVVTSGPQTWPNLVPGMPASNLTPFTFSVPDTHPCGAPVNFDLTLNTASGSCVLPVSFATGRPVTNVFSYTGPVVTVPTGNTGSNIALPVAGLGGNVIDVDLLIDGATCDSFSPASGNGINYPAPGVVDLTLSSPNGTSVVVQNGVPPGNVSSANSNICGTEYDDENPGVAIPATINGNFINQSFFPSSPLSAFDGQGGNGNWTLNVVMSGNYGAGATFGDRTVTAWGLRITTVVCDPPKDTADLAVTKSAPASAELGVAFPYSITVVNNGPDTATNVVLTDTLPAGLTPSTVGPFALGTLANGASTTVTFMVTANAPLRTLVNCAEASSADVIDPVMANNTNCANTILVDARGDLSLSASGPATIACGETITYNLIVSNLSLFIASNVVVTSTVPDSCVAALDATDPCTVVSAGEVVCVIPSVAINGSVQLDIDVMAVGCCASFTNESSLFLGNDTNAANNAASVVTTQTPDMTPPSFGALVPGTIALLCNPDAATFPDPRQVVVTATDNCGVSTSFFQSVDGQTGCDFNRTISYTAIDLCGNATFATSVVTWTIDTAPPTFGVAVPATLDLGCNPLATDFPDNAAILASATDNCGIASRSATTVTNGGPCAFNATITYVAEDSCGFAVTSITTVTWSEDVAAPSFGNCTPTMIDLGCNPDAAAFPDPALVLASATDICGVVTSWVEAVRSSNNCTITMVQDFYAVDACNLTGTCQRTIQWIESGGGPSFTTAPAPMIDLGCNPTAADFPDVAGVLASATDDCGILSSSANAITNGGPCAFTATYTWTAVDTCNVTSETVTVVNWREDLTAPNFVDCSPASTNLGCNPLPADFPDPAIVLVSATDNCGVVTSWVDAVRNTNGCDIVMTQNFYAVDACGLTGSCQRVVQWTQSSAESTFPLAPAPMLDLGCNPAPADFPDVAAVLASASSTCGLSTSSASVVTNSNGPCNFSVTYTWTAVDSCGVLVEAVTLATWIEDSAPPTFADCTPANTDLGCNPAPADFPDPVIVLASASDSCGILNTWVDNIQTTNGCAVTLVETFYAVDNCGLTGTCQRTTQWITDPQAPSFPAAPAAVLELGCNPPATAFPDLATVLASATDNCGLASSSANAVTNGGPCAFSATYTWTAVDSCGITGQTVTVVNWIEDNVAPTFNCGPTNIDLGCNPLPGDFPDPALVLATASDNCGVVTSWVTTVSTTVGCDVTMVEEFYAVDACNQTGTCQRTIQWINNATAPSFPGAPAATLDLGCNPAASEFPDVAAVLAGATDDCGITSSSASAVTNGGPCVFSATYTWTAVDSCGVTGETVSVVNWSEDTAAPAFTDCSPASVDLGCNPGPADFPDPALVLATAVDNCGVTTSWVDAARSTNGCEITMLQTFYAVDACNQTGTCQRVIVWTDSVGNITFPAAPGPVLDLGCNPAAADFPDLAAVLASATDSCGIASRTANAVTNGGPCAFSATYTWSAVDTCGATATVMTVVNWSEDTEAPNIVCAPSVSLGCNPAPADFPDPAATLATAADNCGVVTSWVDVVRTTNNCERIMVRTFYAVDACNQTGTCAQTIAWTEDSEPPVVTCDADADLGCNPAAIPPPNASASDNCGPVAPVLAASQTTNGCLVTLVRIWNAVDACGQSGSCTQTITWTMDASPPSLACTDQSIPLEAGAALPPAASIAVTDDCGATLLVTTNVLGITAAGDTDTEYVYVATDCAGRSTTCRVAYVYDLPFAPPTIDCPAGPTELGCNPTVPTPDAVLATATGECDIVSATADDTMTMDGCAVTLTRVHLVRDSCDLVTVCTQIFTWTADVEAPTFNCGTTLELGCNPDTIPAAELVLATASDNCGVSTSWVDSVITQTGCELTEIRTFYAVDNCGTTGSCVQVLRWTEDREAPTIVGCPDETLIVVLPGELPQAPVITATDNCGTPTLTTEINPLSTNEFGVDTEYIYTAVDCAGTRTECRVTFTYDYASLPPPTIDCVPDPVILRCGAGFQGLPSVASVLATADSACGIVSNNVETSQVDTPCGSTITRTYTVFDACGRSSVCTDSYTSNRRDFNPPLLSVPADTSICTGGSIDPAVTGMASATDDCGITEITFVDTPVNNACGSGIRRSWTARDFCGNSANLDQLILVAEDSLPAFDCASAAFLSPAPPPANGFEIPDLTSALLGEQPCPVFVTQTPPAGSIVSRDTVVNVVVSNACGRSESCQVSLSIPAGPQAIVGDEVWEDLNANGLLDVGEPPVPGVTVLLLNANGSTAASTMTDGQGRYQFTIDFGSSPPIARGANPSVSYRIAYDAPQYVATRDGLRSVILANSNQSAPFDVTAGDVIQDKDIGIVRPGTITGVVWQDLDNDNMPDDNLAELGINGITVELRRIDNGVATAVGSTRTTTNPQGEQGTYSFIDLLPGEYEIYVDMSSLPQGSSLTPASGALRVTLASGAAIQPNDLQSNFNFTPAPTAAVLLSLRSEAGVVTWDIGTEDHTLGYQLVDLATGQAVGDGFVLATGGGEYQQADVEPGQYALVEIDSDLATRVLGELTVYPEVDAAPTGEPTRLLEADLKGALTFETSPDIDSYFVTGVASDAIVLDISQADAPVRLRVNPIVNRNGTALYFSYPGGATLRIQ